MFDTVEEGFAYLESFVNTERGDYKPRNWRLSRMRALLADFDNPQLAYRTIHVAGSKGKGSTACFLAHICAAHGERVGLYTSPHVLSYRERIEVLDGSLTDELFLSQFAIIASYMRKKAQTVPEAQLPTTFELLTLLAFLCFREAGCSIASIEVGLGGRLDATSLVRPSVCVITPLEYEHTEYLGDTLRSIASEKGAILRRGVPAFRAPQAEEARRTLERIAELRNVALTGLELAIPEIRSSAGRTGTEVGFTLPDGRTIEAHLRMLGEVQARNAALATLAATALYSEFDTTAAARGLERAVLPGRSQIIDGTPTILIDGAHTPRSIELLIGTVNYLTPRVTERSVIFGSVRGKKYREMLEIMVEAFDTVIICRPGTFKASDPQQILEACQELGGNCVQEDDADRALELAASGHSLVVVAGSFYLAGKIRSALDHWKTGDGKEPSGCL